MPRRGTIPAGPKPINGYARVAGEREPCYEIPSFLTIPEVPMRFSRALPLAVTVLAINMIGDGLRDLLKVR